MPKFNKYILIPAILFSMIVTPVSSQFVQAQVGDAPNAEPSDESPLLREPQTPDELFKAALLMVKLGQPKLAREYLKTLTDSNPSDEVVLQLREDYGPGDFLRLAGIEGLRPYSTDLLNQMNDAFRQVATSPERIQSLIVDLKAGGAKQKIALTALKDLGAPVVPALLSKLALSNDPAERDTILFAIVQIGKPAVPVLVGGVVSGIDAIQDASIEALGWVGDRDVIPYLWYPAFGDYERTGVNYIGQSALMRIMNLKQASQITQSNLAAELNRLTQLHLSNEYAWPENENGKVEMWLWSNADERLVLHELTSQEASLIAGAYFSRQSLSLSPENSDIQATYLALALAADYYRVGWDRALPTGTGSAHDLALTAGPDVLSEALNIALNNGNTLAVLGTLQALSQVASQQQLQFTDARRAPLLAALSYPSHRVQFAAATAILQIDPDKSFAGSGRVVDILIRAMNDNRQKSVVVSDPDVDRGREMSARFENLGFVPQHFRTGRELFTYVSSRMDVELIVLHINTIRWDLSQTVANLRADARTSAIPIIIYGPQSQEFKLSSLIERTPMMTYLSDSLDPDFFNRTINEFIASLSTPELNDELRQQQVESAAYWLAMIGSGRRARLYDLAPAETALTAAVNDPELTLDALLALSSIGTKSSQRTLLSVALQPGLEPKFRRSSAYQLAYHVQRHGWLLGEKVAQTLKQAHSEEQDAEVGTALAAVIGSLRPNAKLVGERLQKFDSAR